MDTTEILRTGAAALLFAAVFLVGGGLHPLRGVIRDRRSVVSFGAGMSAAYVFVHVMPELHGARSAVAEALYTPLPYEGMSTYFLALLGFLAFYALEHFSRHLRASGEGEEEPTEGAAFRLHLGGFALYVWLMGYLLVRNLEETTVSTWLFALAIAFHFLALDHSLRSEYGTAYERRGRYVLAAMAPLGWAVGQLVALPILVLAMMVAFISGAVIVNSAIMELPKEKDGRFGPFLAGGLIYGLVLIPLG